MLAQPLQLGDALWRAQSADIRPRDTPGGLVVCGMGGSAIGGDLATAALGDRATRPITDRARLRARVLDPARRRSSCARATRATPRRRSPASRRPARPARSASCSPPAASWPSCAREEGVPVIGVPAGMQPRAAVVYMTIGVLECAALCGAAPALHAEIDTAAALLERLVEEWGPDAPDDSLAKSRRAAARRDDPGGPRRRRARRRRARRWATQINENAEVAGVLVRAARGEPQPDLRLGARPRRWPRSRASSSSDPDQHPRVQRRIELIDGGARARGRARRPASHTAGDSRLERVLSLVLLGDLVSVYMAVLGGRGPDPDGGASTRLKQQL